MTACLAAGVTKQTLANWMTRARGQRLSPPYRQFRNAIRQAKAEAAVRKATSVFANGDDD
jgi:hypothetical protein